MFKYDNFAAVQAGKAIATFDYDDTLTTPRFDVSEDMWVTTNEPNEQVVAELTRLASRGWKIHIVTSRKDTKENREEINGFIETHKLPILSLVFTSLQDKSLFIVSLKSIRHYDDDPYEIEYLPDHVSGVLIKHPAGNPSDSLMAYLGSPS